VVDASLIDELFPRAGVWALLQTACRLLAAGSWLLAAAPSQAQTAWPRITMVTPAGGQRGTTVDLTVSGINVGRGTGLLFEGSGLTVESVTPEPPASPGPAKPGEKPAAPPKNPEGKLVARVRIAADAEPGVRALRVLTPLGPSNVAWFAVGQWPEIAEREPNNTPDQAQEVHFPVTVNGRIDPAEDVDVFRFHAEAGRTLLFEVIADRLGSPLDSLLSLQDATGRELAVNDDFNGKDSLLTFTVPATGDYFVVLRDLNYHGGSDYRYRLSMGELPYVTSVFPMGGPPGSTLPLALTGINLDASRPVSVSIPADAAPGALPMALSLPNGASNRITLAVGEKEVSGPELMEAEPNDDPARAQPLPVPATVNGRICPASGSSGPDVDCYRFHAAKGEKLILEVFAHRYGSPLDSLLTVMDGSGKELDMNDDAVGKDSRLEFTAPETGEYIARITDLQERGGPSYTYRFCITPAAPDFRLTFTPDRLALGRGGRAPLRVTAERLNGFEGEIALEVTGLPNGASVAGPSHIRAGQKEAYLVLAAAPDAPLQAAPLRVTGLATIAGQTLRRAAQGMAEVRQDDQKTSHPLPLATAAVAEPPDLIVTTITDPLTLSPGKSVEIAVRVERKNGFTGKIPLAVLGLPDGVTADTPEIAENKTEAKITLKAEEKAAPGEREIVVTARSAGEEQAPAPHAAVPITLTVVSAAQK
jgi:pre-peptidase